MLISDTKLRIWDGVFDSFADAGCDAVFQSDFYVEKMLRGLDAALALDAAPPSPVALARDYLLPAVVAMAAASRSAVKVLDFGGGVGLGYLSTRRALAAEIALRFRIIDNSALCDAAADRLKDHPEVHFESVLGEPQAEDILHLGSSVQYVEEPGFLFDHAVACGVQYIVVSDFPCGAIPTFVTRQHHYGKNIPIKFWNIDEFTEMVAERGYRRMLYQPFRGVYLKDGQNIDMENFPPERRIREYKQLLFVKAP